MWKFDRDRLSILRDLKGLSQVEAAALLGLKRQQWNDWERGKVTPSVATIVDMSNQFDCNPAFFFVQSVKNIRHEDAA